MGYYHRKCGGDIAVLTMHCKKCGKRWNPISFLFNNDIRMAAPTPKERKPILLTREAFIDKLPKWPRWARILSSVIVLGGLITGLVLLFRSCH